MNDQSAAAIVGGGIIVALSGSPVHFGALTGVFVTITYGALQSHGLHGLFLFTITADALPRVKGRANGSCLQVRHTPP